MPILFSPVLYDLLSDDLLVYVDAGARGILEGPWADVRHDRLKVVAFEADPAAHPDLVARANGRDVVATKALWSKVGKIPVHLARNRGTSSVHPPNFALLERFSRKHAEPRATNKIIEVESTTLDLVLEGLGMRADFLKIDTQGAEYEILVGSSKALHETIFGVIAETWTVEVHAGQRLSGEIMQLMNEHGFMLADLSIAAAWNRRNTDALDVGQKRQVVGLDLLFFKEPSLVQDRFHSPVLAAKAAAIAELYGFPDLAVEILDIARAASPDNASLSLLRAEVIASVERRQTPTGKLEWITSLYHRLAGSRRRGTDVKLHY